MPKTFCLKIIFPVVTAATLALFCLSGCTTNPTKTSLSPIAKSSQEKISSIEQKYHVVLGVSTRDQNGKVLLEWRSRERFPLTSTVKALQCARVYDLGLENVRAPINTVKAVAHSPVLGSIDPKTEISLKEACRAALSQSDNRAANFIFFHTGGPKALTTWLRQKADQTTRSDRLEPDLNRFPPNEYRDTTTPSNASLTWYRLDTSMAQSAQTQWLEDLASNQTASNLLRSSLPEGWLLYGRSGAGADSHCSSRALHAILVSDEGDRHYVALHLLAPAKTPLMQRDAIMQKAIEVIYRQLN